MPAAHVREQLPQLAQRCARRTARLTSTIGQVAITLAGRAGSALLGTLSVVISRSSLLRTVMALPLPTGPVPAVLSVDDVALRRGHRYMTMVIDPVTHRRIEVLPDRRADTVADWLRDRPGIAVVCRDGSAAYVEAITQGAPDAVQVSDRWHLWRGLGAAVEKTVIAHRGCWHPDPIPTSGTPILERPVRAIDERNRARHTAVHELLSQGVGLLECTRRLGWALNTVKRYARASTAEELIRPPRYGTTMVDPHRDHLRRRLAVDPDVPVTQLLAEIRKQGYVGSANLLVRYLNQGRAHTERAVPTPRRLVSWTMSRPTDLASHDRLHLDDLLATCPHLTAMAERVRSFAGLLTQRRGQELTNWMSAVESTDLPALHSFVRGLRKDLPAVVAGLTQKHSSGAVEGAVNRIILWNLICQVPPGFSWFTDTIGSRLTVGGALISRGVAPAGVGVSISRSRRLSRAVWPSSTAARSSSVRGMVASMRWRLSLASSSCPVLEVLGV